ncbi:MAG: cytochrome c maturation protein CcmE [Vicinamibacteria bacterium]
MSSNDGRKRVALALGACALGGAILYFVVGGIGQNLVYYWGPTEVLAAGPKAEGASIRLGGLVEKGSITKGDGSNLQFMVTDGKKSVHVRCTSVPPQMFREGIGVVVEGTMAGDGVFESHRLMVSHGNEYRAPNDPASIDLKKLMDSTDGLTSSDKK